MSGTLPPAAGSTPDVLAALRNLSPAEVEARLANLDAERAALVILDAERAALDAERAALVFPKKSDLRPAFVASPGHLLLEVDYRFIELVTLAAVCTRRYGQSALGDVIKAGRDPHAHTAALMLNMTPEGFLAWKKDPTREAAYADVRSKAKAVNFGVPGGLGAASLARTAKKTYGVVLTEDEARQKREQLLDIYPELRTYLTEDACTILARNLKADPATVRGWWGDLHLPCARKVLHGNPKRADGQPYKPDFTARVWAILTAVNKNPDLADDLDASRPSKELADRVCLAGVSTLTGRTRGRVIYTACRNTPFQGLAADGAALALFALIKAGFRVVGFVHDAFLIELPDAGGYVPLAKVRQAEDIVCREMARVLGCDLPVTVESKLARRWYKDGKLVIEGDRVLPWVPKGGEPEAVADISVTTPAVTPAPVPAAPAVPPTAVVPALAPAVAGPEDRGGVIEVVKKLPPLERLLHWITERESVRQKRRAGLPPPWTEDPILREYRFTNVRRMDDKVSRWLMDNWYTPNRGNANMLPACALARYFNSPPTLEAIGFPDRWDPGRVKAVLAELKASGVQVFNAAYIIPPPGGAPDKATAVIDCIVQPLVDDPPTIDTSSMERTHAALMERDGFGSFLAGQVVADLRWAVEGVWADQESWAPQGPGSTRGLNRLLGRHPGAGMFGGEFREQFSRVLAEVRKRLPPDLAGRVEAMDVQGTLCELSKYEKALWNEGTPKQRYGGGRLEAKPAPVTVPAAPPPAPPEADVIREASPPAPAAPPAVVGAPQPAAPDAVEAVLRGEGHWSVGQADVLDFLAGLPEGSTDLIFFSPPYEAQRTYGIDFALQGQAWVDWMVRIFQAALRVCKGLVACVCEGFTRDFRWSATPALLLADLHRAGVHLRKPPAYRRVSIPGSGGPDWLRNDYELIICATRGGKLPWADPTACGQPPKWAPGGDPSHRTRDGSRVNRAPKLERAAAGDLTLGEKLHGKRTARGRRRQVYTPPEIANPGNVVQRLYTAEEVAALLGRPADVVDCVVGGGRLGSDLASENEAPFPERLAEFFVRSFCPPGGLVCDPFLGSGTTGAVAVRCGRRFLGCDVRESQADLSRRRLAAESWESALSRLD
jgi:hypothetical protein